MTSAVATFKEAWANRATLGSETKQQSALEFLPAALEVQQRPPNPLTRWIAYTLMALFTIAVFWACIGKVNVVATAEGKIIPSSRIKHIQPLEKGVVQHIYVSDGQHVKKGETLIVLDRTLTAADKSSISNAYIAARLTEGRLQQFIKLLTGKSQQVEFEVFSRSSNGINISDEDILQHQRILQQMWQQYKAQMASLQSSKDAKQAELETIEAQIDKLQQTLPIVNKRADNYKKLLQTNMVAEDQYLAIEQERIEMQQELVSHKAQGRQLVASIKETAEQLTVLKTDMLGQAYKQQIENNQQIKALAEEFNKVSDINARQVLYAPVDGVVQELKINTIGGVVTEAQDLMTIVPSDEVLEVQAYLQNKDIGFVEADMPAEIKINTFPFTKYGVINATVKSITDDALANQEEGLLFAMLLVMEKNTIVVNGRQVGLRPGMQVSAEVKIGKRRIIEYILTPIIKGFKESVRER